MAINKQKCKITMRDQKESIFQNAKLVSCQLKCQIRQVEQVTFVAYIKKVRSTSSYLIAWHFEIFVSATDDITACCKSNRVTVITNTDIIVSNYMTYAACLLPIKKQV